MNSLEANSKRLPAKKPNNRLKIKRSKILSTNYMNSLEAKSKRLPAKKPNKRLKTKQDKKIKIKNLSNAS
jgi:hypothetical protein